jgi:tetratricopeptide (TPR) repeat protein
MHARNHDRPLPRQAISKRRPRRRKHPGAANQGEAITSCQDAAAIYRETGDRHNEGMALGNLGLALRDAQRFEEAITSCQDAAAIFRETGDRRSEGMALGNLAAARDAQRA